MRLLCVAVAFFLAAASAYAEPFEGLRPGMTRDEAKRVLGPTAVESPVEGGLELIVERPDGRMLSVIVCQRGGRNDVSMVIEKFGTTISAFVGEVNEVSRTLGVASYAVYAGPPGPQSIAARWSGADSVRAVQLWSVDPGVWVTRALMSDCR